MRTLLPTAFPAPVMSAALVSAALLTGCDSFNDLYKQDTGPMERVAAPNPAFTPIVNPDADVAVDAADASPEVLAGEGPDAIQPLDADADADAAMDADAAPAPEVVETYTVQKGDTLGHISQKLFGTVGRTKDLIDANPGIKPNRMQIGDVINVPR